MALRDLLARLVVQVDGKALLDIDKRLGEVKAKAGSLQGAFDIVKGGLAAIGVGIGAAAIWHFTEDVLQQADALAKQSSALGVSAIELQGWQHAAALSGSSAEEFSSAFTKFTRNVAEGAQSVTGPAAAAFKSLGVKIKDSAGNLGAPIDLLDGVVAGLDKIQDPAKRTALVMDLFGRSGARLLPLLGEGTASIAAMRAEVEELGAGFSESFLDDAQEVNDNLDRFKLGIRGIGQTIISWFLPYLRTASEYLVGLAKAFVAVVRDERFLRFVKVIAAAIGVALIPTLYRAAAAFLRLAAAQLVSLAPWIALGLILEDVITFLQGGDSETRRLIDTMFGAGAAQAVLDGLADAWGWIKEKVYELIPVIVMVYDWIATRLPGAWEIVKGVVVAVLEGIGGGLKWLGDLLGETVYMIVQFFTGGWDEVGASARRLFDDIAQGVTSMYKRVTGLAGALGSLAKGDFSIALETAKRAIGADPTGGVALPPTGAGAGRGGATITDASVTTIQVTGATNPAETARQVAGVIPKGPNLQFLAEGLGL